MQRINILHKRFEKYRRINEAKQNASNRTDHGNANNMLLINSDLKYKVDFKNVYASVLRKWLNADDVAILGKKYDYLSFV